MPAAAHAALQAKQAAAAHFAAQQAAHARAQAGAAIGGAARSAVIWGVLSALCICSPITSIIAFVSYSRAKEAARQAGTPVPTGARAGFWLALLGLLWFVGICTYAAIDIHADNERAEARKSELEQKLKLSDRVKLDHDSACELAELHILTAGYAGDTNVGQFRDFVCAGALTLDHEQAALADFKFRTSASGTVQTISVCLKHGDRWFVDHVSVTECFADKAADAGNDAGKPEPGKKAPKKPAPAPAASR